MKSLTRLIRFFAIAAAIFIPSAMMITEVVLYSQNSLYLNNEWIVQKRMRQTSLMGADEFLLSRHPLAQNKINLGHYFGFQEIIYRHNLSLSKIEFEFEIENKSYLDFTFGRNEKSSLGIRLSRNSEMPSAIFKSTRQGQFVEFNKLPFSPLSPGWHKAVILDSSEGLSVSIDDTPFIVRPKFSTLTEKGLIGFRTGHAGAKINYISYQERNGPRVHLTFRNTHRYLQTFLFHLAILLFTAFLLARLMTGDFLATSKKVLFQWIFISALGFFCTGLWYLFDYFYYSPLIPLHSSITRPLLNTEVNNEFDPEHLRFLLFQKWYQFMGAEIISHSGIAKRGYPSDQIGGGPIYCTSRTKACKREFPLDAGIIKGPTKQSYHLVFIGSSQTIGAGADTLEETFFVRIHRDIAKSLPPSIELKSINISESGQDSTALFNRYKNQYLKIRPDLVVINLSNNDRPEETFHKNMEEILTLHQKQGIKTILVEEANFSRGRHSYGLERNHKVLRKLAQDFQLPLIPLHYLLNKKENLNSGTLWWDFVHLSSYGQQLAAQEMTPLILNELLEIPAKKQSPH